jgi:GT2 family glycosyltransferase
MQSLAAIVTALYAAVCVALILLATYRLALLCAWGWQRRLPRRPDPQVPAVWPHVTVQLPIYNERFVVRRLLGAVAALDYRRDRLQIQVLDDSTDRTATLVRRAAAVLRRRGFDIEVRRRADRTGFKAGALADGLLTTRGEYVAIFDADFVPPPEFLRRVIPHAMAPGVGAVQARWGHLDRDASWFTRLQAVLLDGHFAIEQPTRDGCGWFLTFNGTAGVWRRAAIESAGGWSADTLTEDLDLSLRAQLGGWRIRYLHDMVVPAELPIDSNAFRSQQRRWNRGGAQVARKLLPRIVRAPLAWRVKLEVTAHLVGYLGYPLLVLLVLLRTPARLLSAEPPGLGLLPGELPLFVLGTLPLALFYVHAQRAAGVPGSTRRLVRDALPAMALGAGLALSNAGAVVAGLCGRNAAFERTPKRGDVRAGAARRAWRAAAYRSPGTRAALFELGLLAYLVLSKLAPEAGVRVGEIPFLAFFTFGLAALSLRSLRDEWRREGRPAAAAAGATP